MAKERTDAHRWLSESFARFVAELHKQRRRVENAAAEMTPFGKGGGTDSVSFESVQRELKPLLEDLEVEASGYLRPEAFKRAQYAMAVLADEIFMKHMSDWDGAQLWQDHPLEVEIFGSQDAATLFFKKADETLQSADRADTPVAEVYYYALALGFEGMLDQKERADYMRKLAVRFGQTSRRARELTKLTQQAYRNLHVESKGGLLPALWKTVGVLGAVAVLAAVGLIATYSAFTHDVSKACSEILDASPAGAAPTDGASAPATDTITPRQK